MGKQTLFIYHALIKWYPLGIGRSRNYLESGTKYAPLINIPKDNSYWSIVFNITDMNSSNESHIDFEFLMPINHNDIIDAGDVFYICEGMKRVAEGVVISVKEK